MSGATSAGPAPPPQALAEVSVLKGLGAAALRRLALGARLLHLTDGARVFAQGDPADCVFAVLSGEGGRVRVGALEASGKRLLVEIFGPGEVFGELGVLTGASRNAAAAAEGRVRLARLRSEDFLGVLGDDPRARGGAGAPAGTAAALDFLPAVKRSMGDREAPRDPGEMGAFPSRRA